MEGIDHRVMNVIELRLKNAVKLKDSLHRSSLSIWMTVAAHWLPCCFAPFLSVNINIIMPLFSVFRMINSRIVALSIPGATTKDAKALYLSSVHIPLSIK